MDHAKILLDRIEMVALSISATAKYYCQNRKVESKQQTAIDYWELHGLVEAYHVLRLPRDSEQYQKVYQLLRYARYCFEQMQAHRYGIRSTTEVLPIDEAVDYGALPEFF